MILICKKYFLVIIWYFKSPLEKENIEIEMLDNSRTGRQFYKQEIKDRNTRGNKEQIPAIGLFKGRVAGAYHLVCNIWLSFLGYLKVQVGRLGRSKPLYMSAYEVTSTSCVVEAAMPPDSTRWWALWFLYSLTNPAYQVKYPPGGWIGTCREMGHVFWDSQFLNGVSFLSRSWISP